MDLDHSASCERRLFGRKCTCDAAERAQQDHERDSLLAQHDGKMPLASERAREEKPAKAKAPEGVPTDLAAVIVEATTKLTGQGLTEDEALKVIERRIRG